MDLRQWRQATHKTEGESIRKATVDQERHHKETAERGDVARQASLYRTRQDELRLKLRELEAGEAVAAEAYSRQKEATITLRRTTVRSSFFTKPPRQESLP